MQGAVAPLSDSAVETNAATAFSVIIPAHNEETVIARCLDAIYHGAPGHGNFEVIVVANGCTDGTVAEARRAAPTAMIIELDEASKSAAINAGIGRSRFRPCLILDADVVCAFGSLHATARTLIQSGVMAASPSISVAFDHASRWVCAYYRVWLMLPYVTRGMIGGGVYGLSELGASQVFPLPQIVSDDLFVRTRFPAEQRKNIKRDAAGNAVMVTMYPPRTAWELIRIEARRFAGQRQIEANAGTIETGGINGPRAILGTLAQGANLLEVSIFALTKLSGRALYLWRRVTGRNGWSRDNSSRSAQ